MASGLWCTRGVVHGILPLLVLRRGVKWQLSGCGLPSLWAPVLEMHLGLLLRQKKLCLLVSAAGATWTRLPVHLFGAQPATLVTALSIPPGAPVSAC